MPFHDEVDRDDRHVDAEEVSSIVGVLHRITQGDACINDGPGFSFYEEDLDDQDITLDEVREYMAGLDLLGAAHLLSEAFDLLANR